MKVRVSFLRTFLTSLLALAIMAVSFFFLLFNVFMQPNWSVLQWGVIAFVLLSYALFLVMSIKRNYYEVNRKYVTVIRGRREIIYYYSDVVYIDERQSEKKRIIHFYTNKGHVRYLAFDKDGILYKTMLSNCKNRLSEEDFKEKYPNVKL